MWACNVQVFLLCPVGPVTSCLQLRDWLAWQGWGKGMHFFCLVFCIVTTSFVTCLSLPPPHPHLLPLLDKREWCIWRAMDNIKVKELLRRTQKILFIYIRGDIETLGKPDDVSLGLTWRWTRGLRSKLLIHVELMIKPEVTHNTLHVQCKGNRAFTVFSFTNRK